MSTALPGNWDEPDPELLDGLTRDGTFAADAAAMETVGTPHDKTRAAVRAALRMLLANGMITAVPKEDWPEWVQIDPPQDAP